MDPFGELFEVAQAYEPREEEDWENDPFFACASLLSEVFSPRDQANMRQGWNALSGAFFMLNIFLSRGIPGSEDVDKCIRLIALIVSDYGRRHYGREEDWASGFMYWYIVDALDTIVRCPADAWYFEGGDSERAQIIGKHRSLFSGAVPAEFWDRFVPDDQKLDLEDDLLKHSQIWGHFRWYYSVPSITRRFRVHYPCVSEDEAMARLRAYFRVEVA